MSCVRRASRKALAKAEADASEYTDGIETTYLGFADVFHLSEEQLGDKTEVYSLMRTSDLADDAFISRYFNDGTEHSRAFEEPERK